VITYLGITLNNRKFYVGSAVDFERRQKAHLKSKDNYPFQNALRKDPDNVYWIASDNDGSDGREEEQFYLDFYHGSEWCYNLSPYSNQPLVDADKCRENGLKTAELGVGLHDSKNKNLVVEGGRRGGLKTHELHGEEISDRMKQWHKDNPDHSRESMRKVREIYPNLSRDNGESTGRRMVEEEKGWMNPGLRLKGGDSAQKKFGVGVVMTDPEGVETHYPSYKKASQATGVPIATIADMCKGSKSKKWDWTARRVTEETN
jgi:hypothetical protein